MSRRSARIAFLSVFVVLATAACGNTDTPAKGPDKTADTVIGQDTPQVTGTDAVDTVDVGTDAGDTGSTDADIGEGTDAIDIGPDIPPDIAPDTGTVCPGGNNCACADDSKCNSGKCLETQNGKQCAQPCSDTGCPAGTACKQVGGSADPTTYCVSNFLTTCSPCSVNKDCAVNGVEALCIDYGAAGKFCGGVCTADSDCPAGGYACADVTDSGSGKTSKQCKLKATTKPGSGADCSKDATVCGKGETCEAGKCALIDQPTCGCSEWAKGAGLSTECSIGNEFGTCKATRKCTPDGLGTCGAKTPVAESCNSQDDNCDGVVDNLAPDFKCFKAAFKVTGSATVCKSDDDCTKAGEACDTTQGKCLDLIGKCYGKPTCASNGELSCNDAKTPKLEQCNGEDDDCDGKVDEDFPYTSPAGVTQAVGDSCGAGACTGGTVQCKDLLTAVCSTDTNIAKESCDAKDNDCNGKTDDLACDDGNPCTDDTCDGATGKCAHQNNVSPCDDANLCTSDDKCTSGVCVGNQKPCTGQCSTCDTANGLCTQASEGSSCDDGNKCTSGDKCSKNPQSNVFECLPGKDQVKCDDSNVCTDDVCDVQKGCLNSANAETVTCYDAAESTKGIGTCKAGAKFCKDGKLDSTCTGQVIPTASEACDGKDDNCNGVVDEGCKPTSVAVTFSSAYVSGKSGNMNLQMLVGPSGPVGTAEGSGKYTIRFGFLAWLLSILK
jgi:hypothetical protein